MIAEVPVAVPTVLYRFYNNDDALLYAGITVAGQTRWQQHRRTVPWWAEVAVVTVEHFPGLAEAKAAELAAIRSEHPLYNVMGIDPPPGRRPAVMRAHGVGSIFQGSDRKPGIWSASAPNGMGRATWEFTSRELAETFLAAYIACADVSFRRRLQRALDKLDRKS